MKLKAHINHGRWIADCPQCGGSEIVYVGRPFVCQSMLAGGFHGEHAACGFTADVEFPGPDEKQAIEAVLIQRPIKHRNWEPGETVLMLIKENEDNQATLKRM